MTAGQISVSSLVLSTEGAPLEGRVPGTDVRHAGCDELKVGVSPSEAPGW